MKKLLDTSNISVSNVVKCSANPLVHLQPLVRAIRFSKIFSDFCSRGLNHLSITLKKDLGEVSDPKEKNCLDENWHYYIKSWFFNNFGIHYIKWPSVRLDSYFLDLILLPGLFKYKIRWLGPREQKTEKILENSIALPLRMMLTRVKLSRVLL